MRLSMATSAVRTSEQRELQSPPFNYLSMRARWGRNPAPPAQPVLGPTSSTPPTPRPDTQRQARRCTSPRKPADPVSLQHRTNADTMDYLVFDCVDSALLGNETSRRPRTARVRLSMATSAVRTSEQRELQSPPFNCLSIRSPGSIFI